MAGLRESIADYRTRLAEFPRVQLGHFPTPLDPLPRLSTQLGPRLMVKRDDCSGLAFGGNKVRQHEYVLGDAIRQGADCVIHGAAAQSNQSRQLAAAGARLGLDVFLLPRRDEGTEAVQGNYLLNHMLGADIRQVDPDASMIAAKQALFEKLVGEGRQPYLIGMGSSRSLELAALAYVDALFEIVEAMPDGQQLHWLYTASQGSTQAGLLAGCELLGLSTKIIGVNPMPSSNEAFLSRENILRLARHTSQAIGKESSLALSDVHNSTEFVGDGYGIPSVEGIAAIRQMASTEGILLDPVYSSKAFAALLRHTRERLIGPRDNVVFLHTGGLPSIFAYSQQLA